MPTTWAKGHFVHELLSTHTHTHTPDRVLYLNH